MAGGPRRRSRGPVRGYASAAQRFAKTRRLAALRERLAAGEQALAAGRPSITVGGNRLWRTRQNLGAAETTEQQWRERWDASRMFLTADGETGKTGGNETIRRRHSGAVAGQSACCPGRSARHSSAHRRPGDVQPPRPGMGLAGGRPRGRCATTSPSTPVVAAGIWMRPGQSNHAPVAELDELRSGQVLGVDLNADHLAACVLDASGNPVGEPVTIEVETSGLRASRRDGRVRASITALLDLAPQHHCPAVVVENLDFADSRCTGRETLGRGSVGSGYGAPSPGSPPLNFAHG